MSEDRNGRENISTHILPTSSNLLGLCFVILTFIKILKVGHETLIDEIVAAAIVLFFVSSFFSYVSMRSDRWTQSCEKIADGIFLLGLFLLSIGSVLVAFEAIS